MVVSGWGGPRWLEDGAMGRCWSSESVELENGERPASTTEKEAGQAATFLNRKAVVCVDLARATAGVGLLAQVACPDEAEGAGAGLLHSALLAGEPGGTIFFYAAPLEEEPEPCAEGRTPTATGAAGVASPHPFSSLAPGVAEGRQGSLPDRLT